MLELQEALPSSPQVTLATEEGNLPRPIALVSGHTYHISCRDTANSGSFDDQQEAAWHFNGNPVERLAPKRFPEEGVAAVYASKGVSSVPNEWTLVLQVFGDAAEGVYSCHRLQEEVLSLDIGLGKKMDYYSIVVGEI